MTEIPLDPRRSALVLIDLQQGIVNRPVAPHSGDDVVERAARLAAAFREREGLVVLVRVAFAADGSDRLTQPTDASFPRSNMPSDWDVLSPALGQGDRDLVITKHQWGAFYGTELDLQLRRRGIQTIVLGGISTNFGVESTARNAHEHGYSLVLVEDAMAGPSKEAHDFVVGTIFPRLGLVRSTAEVLDWLTAQG